MSGLSCLLARVHNNRRRLSPAFSSLTTAKLLVIVAVSVPGVLQASPIDCSKARHPVEKMICSDGLLLQLDEALDHNFHGMIETDIGDGARRYLKSSQRDWLKHRNACRDAACILERYIQRVEAVCEFPVISGVHAICQTAESVLRSYDGGARVQGERLPLGGAK